MLKIAAPLAILAASALLMLAGVASAATIHEYLSVLSTKLTAGVPAGTKVGAKEAVTGPVSVLHSMTVASGHLWTSERSSGTSNERVDEFDAATGAFEMQLPQIVGPEEADGISSGIAVGHTGIGEELVYVGASERVAGEPEGRVLVFGARSGTLLSTWTGADTPGGSFADRGTEGVEDVAVDRSDEPLVDPAAGDVYVADAADNGGREHVVYAFKPEADGSEPTAPEDVAGIAGTCPSEDTICEATEVIPFTDPTRVAVDQSSGEVLVLDAKGGARGYVVDVFRPEPLGAYRYLFTIAGPYPGESFANVTDLAVDSSNGEIYISEYPEFAAGPGVVDQFSSSGAFLDRITGVATPQSDLRIPESVAVDGEAGSPSSGNVFVGDYREGEAPEQPAALDVFGPDLVVPDVVSGAASEVRAHVATLNGTVNPLSAETGEGAMCQFAWGTTAQLGQSIACSPETVAEANSPIAVKAPLSGLQPDTTYYYRLQATNKNGTNSGEGQEPQPECAGAPAPVACFTTLGPEIQGESASAVTSASASLNAMIDPYSSATSYYFQYGTSATYEHEMPAAPGLAIGSGESNLAVSVHLQGLTASTIYHYRVVAFSEPGGEAITVQAPDATFTTQGAATGFALPDDRQWEMVTPPNKQGAGIIPIGSEQGADIQAATGGDAITYAGNAPFATAPAGNRSPEVTQAISTRAEPGSWQTAEITTAHNEGLTGLAVGHSSEYKLFSSDLSLGLVEPAGHTPLSPLPEGSEKTIYLRKANGEYQALVTSANVSAGAKFGGDGETIGGVQFVSATPDFSHVVVESSNQAGPAVELTEGYKGDGLYEWSEGRLVLVSVLPDGQPVPGALGDKGDYNDGNVRHAISSDGSRIIWESDAGNHYYLRDIPREETVEIDNAQGVAEPPSDRSLYQTANSDGTRVFFTSTARLTADSTASAAGDGDLYQFEVTSGEGQPLVGRLTDLTVDPKAGETAAVQGVIGASEDGTYVYFVAGGVLGDGAERGARSGRNLYMEHYDDGIGWEAPVFIAALAGADGPTWATQSSEKLKEMTSRVSPNGRFLAFMSEKSLTGYDNTDANSPAPCGAHQGICDEEVFLYDASTGHLACASCDPTGARPVGLSVGEKSEEKLVDYPKGLWENRWLAGNIPGWTNSDNPKAQYQSRYLSNDGRLFFNSNDALVPADVNGKEDVYEYEPEGVPESEHACSIATTSGSDAFKPARVVKVEGRKVDEGAGCIALISSGTSSEESAFLDASEAGRDVFFMTASKLSSNDYDDALDIYDAHECTSESPCAPLSAERPPACVNEASCKPSPEPQPSIYGLPASATFAGPGNLAPLAEVKPAAKPKPKVSTRARKLVHALKACHKKKGKKREKCEKSAHKRYGAKTRAKRAGNDRRTAR